ncbi:WD40/YVTN/BNR-like repeat-containing protein [Archangium violaceum]|uniref:WD40/YVTN/BNR-like repeat-containing protein n=1 Tax=Archangium violaceum TaxID=83451 RepID=UPI0036D8EB36
MKPTKLLAGIISASLLGGAASLGLSCLGAGIGPGLEVDPDVKRLSHCDPRDISFRNEQEGWLRTACDEWFRTADSGRSWREFNVREEMLVQERESRSGAAQPDESDDSSNGSLRLTDLLWVSSTEGLALVNDAPMAFRTEDGGRSWTRITLPVKNHFYSRLEAVGERLWLCNTEGWILRSDDAGRNWKELTGAPFDESDGCTTLSFVDASDGWAGGQSGALWHTEDGGETWKRMAATDDGPVTPEGSDSNSHYWRHLVRITPLLAWADTDNGRFRTTDGGKTWERLKPLMERVQELRPVVVRPGSRLPWVAHASGDARDASSFEPVMEVRFSLWGEQGVVTDDLEFFQAGAKVRQGLILSAGGSRRVTLQGIEQARNSSWGWADDLVFQNKDGETWFFTGRLPTPVVRLAALESGFLLARGATGELFRSNIRGEKWEKTENLLDVRDFAARVGEPVPPVFAPDCVLSARPASLTVRSGMTSCGGGMESTLTLELGEQGASAEVELDFIGRAPWEEPRKLQRPLARQQAEAAAQALIQAALRAEGPLNCAGTTKNFATLEWTCGVEGPRGGPLELRMPTCEEDELEPADLKALQKATVSGDASKAPGFYSRPVAVAKEAQRISKELLESP